MRHSPHWTACSGWSPEKSAALPQSALHQSIRRTILQRCKWLSRRLPLKNRIRIAGLLGQCSQTRRQPVEQPTTSPDGRSDTLSLTQKLLFHQDFSLVTVFLSPSVTLLFTQQSCFIIALGRSLTASALQPHTLTHSLSLVLVIMMRSKDLKMYSHADSLTFSLSHLSLCFSHHLTTFCQLTALLYHHPWSLSLCHCLVCEQKRT